MTYKLKIHLILKNFFLKLDKIYLLPNFVKKISKIIYEVSNNYTFDRDFNGENKIIIKLKDKYNLETFLMLAPIKVIGQSIVIIIFLTATFICLKLHLRIKILKKLKTLNLIFTILVYLIKTKFHIFGL